MNWSPKTEQHYTDQNISFLLSRVCSQSQVTTTNTANYKTEYPRQHGKKKNKEITVLLHVHENSSTLFLVLIRPTVWHVSVILCSILPPPFLNIGFKLAFASCLIIWKESKTVMSVYLAKHFPYHDMKANYYKSTIPWVHETSQYSFSFWSQLQIRKASKRQIGL